MEKIKEIKNPELLKILEDEKIDPCIFVDMGNSILKMIEKEKEEYLKPDYPFKNIFKQEKSIDEEILIKYPCKKG